MTKRLTYYDKDTHRSYVALMPLSYTCDGCAFDGVGCVHLRESKGPKGPDCADPAPGLPSGFVWVLDTPKTVNQHLLTAGKARLKGAP